MISDKEKLALIRAARHLTALEIIEATLEAVAHTESNLSAIMHERLKCIGLLHFLGYHKAADELEKRIKNGIGEQK